MGNINSWGPQTLALPRAPGGAGPELEISLISENLHTD